MKPDSIIHPGIIVNISGETVQVRILSQSACSSCQVKGACAMAEMEEKMIEIDKPGSGSWKTGDKVMVRMEESMGRKAVLLGYVVPLVIIVVSVIIFLALLNHEGLAALLSILILLPYYFLLYFFRDRLKKEFRFRLEPGEQSVV
ncbi:MAG: SoxR reducing system RseC family protein [Bacteroidales bacterium]